MACVLRAGGVKFDVDEFLKNSTLDILTAFHPGAVQFPTASVTRTSEYSGMNVSVGTREFSDLQSQVEDAMRFLTENAHELRRLRDFPGLDRMEMEFPVEDREMVFQSDAFPPRLLFLLGNLNIGLVISRYPVPRVIEDPPPTEQ